MNHFEHTHAGHSPLRKEVCVLKKENKRFTKKNYKENETHMKSKSKKSGRFCLWDDIGNTQEIF